MNEQEIMQMISQLMGKAGGGAGIGSLLSGIGGGGAGAMGVLGSAGVGALSLGSMAVPGLPLAVGATELITGLIKAHKAQQSKEQLNMPDPNLMRFMNQIDRQRKSFESGSAYGAEMKELKNQEAATQEGVLRAAKGNTGSALAAIEQVGLNTSLGYGKIAAQGQQRQDAYTQMYGSLVEKQEQRKYEQNMDTFNQKNIDARDSQIKGFQTLLNTAALSGKIPKLGGTNPQGNMQGILQQILGMIQQKKQAPTVSPASPLGAPPAPALGAGNSGTPDITSLIRTLNMGQGASIAPEDTNQQGVQYGDVIGQYYMNQMGQR